MRTLLLIDDSQEDLEILQESLQDAGVKQHLTVLLAQDGDEGLDEIRRHRPDLVLLDLNLPRLHGFKVLEALQHERSLIPVVVCSTSDLIEDCMGSLERGARAYLVKPSTYEDTVQMIKRTIDFWEIACDCS